MTHAAPHMDGDAAGPLSRFVAETGYDQIPQAARDSAKPSVAGATVAA